LRRVYQAAHPRARSWVVTLKVIEGGGYL
jgi:hypothetical protein